MRVRAFVCVTIATMLLNSLPAQAQAPMPFGRWRTSPPGEEMLINKDGTCAMFYQGTVSAQGVCTWNPSSKGGILTLTYPMPLEPGKIYWSVVWINRTTITIQGDTFRLVQ